MSSQQFRSKSATARLVKVSSVFREFWKGVRLYKWQLAVIIFGISIANVFDVIVPLYYKRFFDTLNLSVSISDRSELLIKIIFAIAFCNLVIWVSYRFMSFANAYFQSKVMAKLKQQAFEYMIDHSYAFYANNFTGSLVQRVNRFARSFEVLADRFFFNILPLTIRIVGIAIVLWFVNPLITLIIAVWVFVFLSFNYIFARWKLKYDVKRAEADSFSTGVISDAITNQSTIQLFTGAKSESEYYADVTNAQAKITRFTWNLDAVIDAVQSLFIFAIEFLLFYLSIKYWQEGYVSIGVFALIQMYLIGLGGRLWDFSHVIRNIYEAIADAKEMVEILEFPHDIKNLPDASELKVDNGLVCFDNVSFSFNSEKNVLNGINLTIKSGEKIALIGPSGAGKSTFVKLLLRLYDVTSGKILVDNQDIKLVTQVSLRKNISLVPQDPILFHRTLLENIRYGRRDATDSEVLEAARLAHCDEFALSLSAGYGTYVGERGVKLSGGERQRVAIARAILKNAPILVLDEATSSLDSHSESLIQDALDKLMKGKTTIVIAHRLSTIRKMDRIVVVEKGVVVEEGSHDELLKNGSSLYTKLWNLQAGGFIENDGE